MKTKIIALSSLALLMGTGVLINAQTAIPAPTPVQTFPGHVKRERHPELMRAMKTLQRTKIDLQKASRDFGGHRAKAADLTQQAIDEVKLAMQYDKN